MNGGGKQRQLRTFRVQLTDERPREVNRPCPQQHGEDARNVNGQHRTAPRKAFQHRVVDDQIGIIAIGRDLAGGHVRVEMADRIQIVGCRRGRRVDPGGECGGQRVIERRLAGFLPPRAARCAGFERLHRQRPLARQVFDHGVVPHLVRGLEDGDDGAVKHAQDGETDQKQNQGQAQRILRWSHF